MNPRRVLRILRSDEASITKGERRSAAFARVEPMWPENLMTWSQEPVSVHTIYTLPAKFWQEGADGLVRTKQASIPIGAQIRRWIHIVLVDKVRRSASAPLGAAVASRPQPWLV
jgi:hypothetical protein